MPESLSATRTGMRLGLAYTLPLLLWLLGQSWLSVAARVDAAVALGQMQPALPGLQAAALVLCTPWLLRYRGARAQLAGLLMLLWVPLPLYAIGWATAAIPPGALLPVAGALGALLLACYCFYHGLLALLPPGRWRALMLPPAQVGLLLLLWHWRGDSLRLLGI